MGVISRINKSPLNQRAKSVLRKVFKTASAIRATTADVVLTQSSTTHALVTGLSVPVEANKVYQFEACVTMTADSGDGGQISFTGSAAANYINGVFVSDGATASTPTFTVISAITTESDDTECTAAAVRVLAFGTYSPSVDGNFQVAAAQVVSGATDTTVLKGAYLKVTEVLPA